MMEISKKKWDELLEAIAERQDHKDDKNGLLMILAVIGAVCAVVAIAFAVYHHFSPDYLEDFEDEDFDDYFEDEDED